MGPSGSEALFIAIDTKGHLRVKVRFPQWTTVIQQARGRMVAFLPRALLAHM